MVKDHSDSEKEWNVLFNDALNTFYLRLYGVRHMVNDHSERERERERERDDLFNDALKTFYLRLYGVGHMVKDHSDSEREREMIYLTTHSAHFIYGYMASDSDDLLPPTALPFHQQLPRGVIHQHDNARCHTS